MTNIEIINPGLATTIQDLGRIGHQAQGIPVSGAIDQYAHRLANLLVNNSEKAATLEFSILGPTIKFLPILLSQLLVLTLLPCSTN